MIRVPVNLASEPFRPLRPMLVASGGAAVLMLALLGLLVSLSVMQRGQEDETSRRIDRLRTELQRITAEQGKIATVLRKPENAAVFERNLFLNTLIYRKGISWTKMFDDLGQVMPHNVRLISVRPQVNAANEIYLDMVVGAESGVPVLDMLKKLADSPQFGVAHVHNTMPPTQNEPLYRYRVSVNYAQKMGEEKQPPAQEEKPLAGARGSGASAR